MADTPDDLLDQIRAGLQGPRRVSGSNRALAAFELLDTLLSSGAPLPSAWAQAADPDADAVAVQAVRHLTAADAEIVKLRALHGEAANLLSEAGAEIARLTAELDDCRNVPVEYVTERGLEAAMAADPGREDGTILRTTDGQKRAWAWKAATREWEPVP